MKMLRVVLGLLPGLFIFGLLFTVIFLMHVDKYGTLMAVGYGLGYIAITLVAVLFIGIGRVITLQYLFNSSK